LIVIDVSVLANVVGDDGSDGQRARLAFRAADDVAAPDLADVETVAVLRSAGSRARFPMKGSPRQLMTCGNST
jgi:hypothetical protein